MPGAYGWAWNHITEKWERVPSCVTTKRMTGTGQVVEGAHKLYWISMNPSAADSEAALTDNLDGAGDPAFDMFHASRDHMHAVLRPPMPFTTGIYLKTLNHMTSLIFGYV